MTVAMTAVGCGGGQEAPGAKDAAGKADGPVTPPTGQMGDAGGPDLTVVDPGPGKDAGASADAGTDATAATDSGEGLTEAGAPDGSAGSDGSVGSIGPDAGVPDVVPEVGGPPPGPVAIVEVVPASIELDLGMPYTFTAVAMDANRRIVDGLKFTWSTTDTVRFLIDQDGHGQSFDGGGVYVIARSPTGIEGRSNVWIRPAPVDMTPPVLSVTTVDLARVTEFLVFGIELRAPPDSQLNPTYELRVNQPTPVRASCGGTVVGIGDNPQEQGDKEIHIRPSPGSIYLVIYDHVADVVVKTGDVVQAGTVLGTTNGRIELQVNKGAGQDAWSLCPRQLGTTAFNDAHEQLRLRGTSNRDSVCVTEMVKP